MSEGGQWSVGGIAPAKIYYFFAKFSDHVSHFSLLTGSCGSEARSTPTYWWPYLVNFLLNEFPSHTHTHTQTAKLNLAK